MLHALLSLPLLAAPVDVQVITTAGAELTGAWTAKTLELTTDFGTVQFDLDMVGRIDFGDPDQVTLLDGRSFPGEVELKRIRLETAGGSETLRVSELLSIEALVDGRPALAMDFAGDWATSFGPMKLDQRGREVSGTYGFQDEFKLTGTVNDDGELEFVAKEQSGTSEGTWELWEDGDTFTGHFRWNGGDERFWGAYRIAPVLPEPVPGEVVVGQTGSWLNYHLRVPKAWDGTREWPAIAFFHGSNMNSRAYVDTIVAAWPDLAERFVLVGIDGEKLSSRSADGERFYNFTYINFSGHEVGQRWRYRQSPGLVVDALDELGDSLPISKWLVGGHSQGGFLTYALVMYYPEKIAGAFPMSCNLLVQCEPDNFENEERRRAQRVVALAPIHGQRDSVVSYSSGEYCYSRMQDGGFPTLRFFNPDRVGHEFALLPVDDALDWLDTMTCEDAVLLLELAEAELAADRYRSATAAALRAGAAGATARAVEAIHAAVDAKAASEADRLLAAIQAGRDGDWVEDFWSFRAEFAFTPAAAEALAAYASLREEHTDAADKAFYAARGEEDEAVREAHYQEIVDRWYASKWYPLVKGWLDD